MQETWVWSLGWEDPLEKGTPTHSSILAWRIPYSPQSVKSPWAAKRDREWATFTFHPTYGFRKILSTFASFMYLLVSLVAPFLMLSSLTFNGYTTIYPFTFYEHLVWFQISSIENKNVWKCLYKSLYGYSLSFLLNCQIVFQSNCNILQSYKQCGRVLVALHPHQYLAYSVFALLFYFY